MRLDSSRGTAVSSTVHNSNGPVALAIAWARLFTSLNILIDIFKHQTQKKLLPLKRAWGDCQKPPWEGAFTNRLCGLPNADQAVGPAGKCWRHSHSIPMGSGCPWAKFHCFPSLGNSLARARFASRSIFSSYQSQSWDTCGQGANLPNCITLLLAVHRCTLRPFSSGCNGRQCTAHLWCMVFALPMPRRAGKELREEYALLRSLHS